jgi:hypothetical protein
MSREAYTTLLPPSQPLSQLSILARCSSGGGFRHALNRAIELHAHAISSFRQFIGNFLEAHAELDKHCSERAAWTSFPKFDPVDDTALGIAIT